MDPFRAHHLSEQLPTSGPSPRWRTWWISLQLWILQKAEKSDGFPISRAILLSHSPCVFCIFFVLPETVPSCKFVIFSISQSVKCARATPSRSNHNLFHLVLIRWRTAPSKTSLSSLKFASYPFSFFLSTLTILLQVELGESIAARTESLC